MDLAAKLQLKADQGLELVATPTSVVATLAELEALNIGRGAPALLVFVDRRATLERHRDDIVDAAGADRLTWVAYPKSGQLGTDLDRDTLAALLQNRGVRPVRQIAIDGIWSALRFRPN